MSRNLTQRSCRGLCRRVNLAHFYQQVQLEPDLRLGSVRTFLIRVTGTVAIASALLAALSCGGSSSSTQTLSSIQVLPGSITVAGTPTIIYTALGHYTKPQQVKDISTQVLWKTNTPSIIAFIDSAHPNYLQPSGSGCGTNLGVTASVYSNPTSPSSGTVVIGTAKVNVQCGNGSGADFSLVATPLSATVGQGGGGATYTITEKAVTGSPTVALQITGGVPVGANATVNPASITGSGFFTLTITTTGGTPAGTYPILITGSDSTSSLTISVVLVVS